MSRLRGECPTCVRVTCVHASRSATLGTQICGWTGYRPKSRRDWRPCPWCYRQGPWDIQPVFHRLSTICKIRKFARGEGPV